MNKTDVNALKRGLRRMVIALLTVVTFVVSLLGFIAVAMVPGYLAVLAFFVSVFAAGFSFVLLYAQGTVRKKPTESQGETNE